MEAAIRLLTPRSPGSDLNPVIRTYCKPSDKNLLYVKCSEGTWDYKLQRHSALKITCIQREQCRFTVYVEIFMRGYFCDIIYFGK